MPHEAAISGKLTHIPDGMLNSQDEAQIKGTVSGNNVFTQVDLSGKLPEYKPLGKPTTRIELVNKPFSTIYISLFFD
ncbi:MAG: hypothetical protein AAF383_03490 [Cyanobacteria bacterium P01_A01_bin.83]